MSSIESVKRIKEEYIKVLAENPEYIKVLEALLTKSEAQPITSFRELNPEGLPDFKNKERQLSTDRPVIQFAFCAVSCRTQCLFR